MAQANDTDHLIVDGQLTTVGDLRTRLWLAETSVRALTRKLDKTQRVSRSRLKRMNQRGKLLIEARANLFRITGEAHGG